VFPISLPGIKLFWLRTFVRSNSPSRGMLGGYFTLRHYRLFPHPKFLVFTHHPVTCSVLETPFGLLLYFIYFTSRHHNYFYNVTRGRLTASSLPCCFLVLVGPLIADFLVAALISLFVSDRFL
jgi:hypothetical protein